MTKMEKEVPGKTKALLVVDDCPFIRKVIKHIANQMGMTVYTAENGVAALIQISRVVPDLITLDGEMPGIGGLKCLAEIRKRWPHIPVLMVSGSNDHAYFISCLRQGANDYLLKPFTKIDLERKIQRVLSRTHRPHFSFPAPIPHRAPQYTK